MAPTVKDSIKDTANAAIDTVAAYTGNLTYKSKGELTAIAESLGLPEYESMHLRDLKIAISDYLEDKKDELQDSPQYKGLYKKARGAKAALTDPEGRGNSETPEPVAIASQASRHAIRATSNAVDSTVKASKGKARDLANAAGIDSDEVLEDPVGTAKSAANAVAVRAEPVVNDAIARTRSSAKELVKAVQQTSKKDVEVFIRNGQQWLSNSTTIVTFTVFLELIALLAYLVPWSHQELQFPPSQWSRHASLRFIHSIFFWVPEYKQKFYIPDTFAMFRADGAALGGFLWWLFFTLIPPYLLSHVVSFIPQKKAPSSRSRNSANAPQSGPTPTMDPLVFAITRLAILIYPLTSAAPDLWVNQLEKLGSLQGRALAAGLTAGYVLCDRLAGLV